MFQALPRVNFLVYFLQVNIDGESGKSIPETNPRLMLHEIHISFPTSPGDMKNGPLCGP
jgi:hypothetical protein